jgi:GNAT superfamily N-acetyltransferase
VADLDFREFQDEDFDAVRTLYQEVWREARDERYDRMRYLETMHGRCIATIAMDGDVCAGWWMVWPLTFAAGPETVLGGQAIDTMTHPAYQGRGLFVRLASMNNELCAKHGLKLLIGMPNRQAVGGYQRHLAWATPTSISAYVRPLSLRGFMPGGGIFSPALRLLPTTRTRGREVGRERPSDVQLEACLSASAAPKNIWRIQRSPRWYSYRYQAAGKVEYRWCAVYKDGALDGFAVWGLPVDRSVGMTRANLVDLVGSDEGMEVAAGAAVRDARDAGADLLAALVTSKVRAKPLVRNSFVRYRATPLIARGLDAASFSANPYDARAWDLFGGDFDIV